jgi:undecaprenyl-diphosphatase
MTVIQAIILAIIEGITEFLPVSSTGHMIIGSSLMGIASEEFTKTFTVAIQLGAILSVLVLYARRFLQSTDFYLKLLVAFIPAAILGKLLNDTIDALLENVVVVAISLLLGGIILVFVDKWFKDQATRSDKRNISYVSAIKIGLFQCIAMIPGVSRSAATIIGGLTQNMSRKAAAEFSFFLAVPTMFAATAYKIFKLYHKGGGIAADQWHLLLIGNAVAFIVALLAIKSFIALLTKYGFKYFGYYRILLGLSILILYSMGIPLKII